MITVTNKNVVEKCNIGVENSFKIKTTSKAFRILSDGLYSDKVKAVIRELSCNAYDAHVEAGKNKTPFVVHLPNTYEPHFSIRDYGAGISHDDVLNIYTTYFESTKTNSNDLIGCLGLGTKSPFSYVDNFTVTSIQKGVKRIYTAFINEQDLPTITLLNECATSEPDGVEVMFGVEVSDTHNFHSKAKDVYHYFKLRPEIKGANNFQLNQKMSLLSGKGWNIHNWAGNGAIAIMGNIPYSLRDFPEKLTPEQSAVVGLNIDIEFSIGALEMSASREKLSYNKQTIESVKNRLTEISSEIKVYVEKSIENCDNLWDARCVLKELSYSTGPLASLVGIFKSMLKWKGQKIDKLEDIYHKVEKIHVERFTRRRNYRTGYTSTQKEGTATIQPHPKQETCVFFINDMKIGSNTRCKQILHDVNDVGHHPVTTVYLISFEEGSTAEENIKNFTTFKENTGMIDRHFKLISSVEIVKDPNRKRNTNQNPKNFCKILEFVKDFKKYDNKDDPSLSWKTVDRDVEQGGIYVTIERYKVNGFHPTTRLSSYINLLKALGEDIDALTIYGIRTNTVLDKIVKNDKWVTLDKYVKGKFEAVNDETKKKLSIIKAFKSYEEKNYRNSYFLPNMSHIKPSDSTSPFNKLKDFVDAAGDKKVLDLYNSAEYIGGLLSSTKAAEGLSDLKREVYKNYPMLKAAFIEELDVSGKKKEIIEYIDLIDTCRKNNTIV